MIRTLCSIVIIICLCLVTVVHTFCSSHLYLDNLRKVHESDHVAYLSNNFTFPLELLGASV